MKKILLTDSESIGRIGGPGMGPFADLVLDPLKALKALTTVISNIIGVMTIAAGIWFMFQFIIAGYNWLTAGGSAESVANAQNRMRNAIIGLVIVVAAWAVVGLIGNLLGLDILIRHPENLIDQLTPGG